ncbi:MAG: nickel-dependent lactate racemase [Promethearchaeota archaeon]
MRVKFDYGREGLEFDVPPGVPEEHVTVLRAKDEPGLVDPAEAVRGALEKPTGTAPLSRMLEERAPETACVVVSDATRPVPTSKLLPPILEALEEGGVELSHVTVLVATGLHRPSTDAERARILGSAVPSDVKVADHDARDDDAMVRVGDVAGYPVRLNRRFVDADFKVLTGYVDPHFFAGFAGGRKSVVPGIAAKETILSNHSAANIAHPRARFGGLEGNPVHEQSLAAAKLAGVDFVVNVTLNSRHEVTRVAAGDLEATHRVLVNHVVETAFVDFPEPFDVVVAGNGGYPLDLNLYQAVKSMALGEMAVKPGGTIVAVNECSDGVGHAAFREMLNLDLTAAQVHERVLDGRLSCEDQWEIQVLARVLSVAKVRVVSTLDAGELGRIGLVRSSSVEEALLAAYHERGPGARVLILPNGPAVVARARGAAGDPMGN